jgi:hypothetical protein
MRQFARWVFSHPVSSKDMFSSDERLAIARPSRPIYLVGLFINLRPALAVDAAHVLFNRVDGDV